MHCGLRVLDGRARSPAAVLRAQRHVHDSAPPLELRAHRSSRAAPLSRAPNATLCCPHSLRPAVFAECAALDAKRRCSRGYCYLASAITSTLRPPTTLPSRLCVTWISALPSGRLPASVNARGLRGGILTDARVGCAALSSA